MLPGRHAHRHLAARASAAERQTWPCHRLSPCHPLPAPQADSAAQSGLSRAALAPPRLLPCVRRLAFRSRREIRLPRHGRASGARTRTCLGGRTRCCAASRARLRRSAGSHVADRTLPLEWHGTAGRHRHAARARHLRPDRRARGRSRMNATVKIDAARVELLLSELRLPGIKLIWAALAETADKEGWPAARFLAALAEQEMVERSRRRFERHLEEARLPPGKTLDAFDFDAVPMVSKAQVQALAAGDAWLEKGANLLCFGPPGGGKSHLAAALGMALIEKGWRVLFTRTTDLVQKLQIARRDLVLEAAIAKLDKYHLLILDDLAYVTKDQAETSVLFELISARYERRSMLITANQPFGEWGRIFPDQAMTLAVVDRLVHHATIFEMKVESYRRRAALERKRGSGGSPAQPTINTAPDCRAATISPPRPLRDNDNATIMPTPRRRASHPDGRCLPIQIAALQSSARTRPRFVSAS